MLNKMLKLRKKNNKGFSLIELIIVIAIMAILVGILAPQFVKYVNQSRESTDIKNMQEVVSAVSVYCSDPANTITVSTALGSFTLNDGKTDSTKSVATDTVLAAMTAAGLMPANIAAKSNTYKAAAVNARTNAAGNVEFWATGTGAAALAKALNIGTAAPTD